MSEAPHGLAPGLPASHPVAAPADAPDLPALAPGTSVNGRVVRATGTLPFSGARYVLYRHTGRHQLAAQRTAEEIAKAEGRAATDFDAAVALLAQVTEIGPALGQTGPVSLDGLLDLDADDLNAVAAALAAGAVPR